MRIGSLFSGIGAEEHAAVYRILRNLLTGESASGTLRAWSINKKAQGGAS